MEWGILIAENAVLGSILKEPYLIKETNLQVEHFINHENKAIFAAMKKLDQSNKPIDLVSIMTTGDVESMGGASNLQQLQAVANPEKFDDHVDIVMDKWREREKNNLLHIATQDNWSIEKVTSELSKLVDDKTHDRHKIADLVADIFEAPWTKQETMKGIPTGLEVVDRLTGGWQNSKFIVIAGRPGAGKTDIALSFSKHAGWHGHVPIFFSLEMPANELRDRLISSVGRIEKGKFKNLERFLTDEEKERWTEITGRVSMVNLEIYDDAGQTLSEIRMKTRKTMSEYPGKKPVIIIDYLQLIRPAISMGGNRNLEVSEISRGLKELAKEFDCPVLCLAQLSRGVEQRSDKRPMLSDLRDSGSIEQDADIVMFLYRDSYYTKDDTDKSLEMIFAKHRAGSTGTIQVYYDPAIGELSM